MRRTPLGKRLTFYKVLALAGVIGMILSFQFHWVPIFWAFTICLILSLALVISIGVNARLQKFNHKGERHGPDILRIYEPGDPEYEYEKEWQEDRYPITVDVNIEFKRNNE